jgi:hypothetical protein
MAQIVNRRLDPRAAALAMGGDWHDLGGALSDDAVEPVALQPLAGIDDAGERGGRPVGSSNFGPRRRSSSSSP